MPRAMTAFFFDAFVLSSMSLLFSTDFRAFVANIKFVLSVVFQPAKNRAWTWWSCARRASPTFSSARAYFSRAIARGSSLAPVGCVSTSNCDPARDARAMAWLKVLGCGLVDGGAVNAAPACFGEEALERRVTLSEMDLPRSVKDSRMFGG